MLANLNIVVLKPADADVNDTDADADTADRNRR